MTIYISREDCNKPIAAHRDQAGEKCADGSLGLFLSIGEFSIHFESENDAIKVADAIAGTFGKAVI